MANYPVYPYPSYQAPYYPLQDQNSQFRQPQIMQPQIMQPQITQPISQGQQTNPMWSGNPNNSIIWVQNYAAANDYLVAANNAVALWDSSAPYVYLKQADSTGKPTIKAYELVERDPNQQNKQATVQLPDFSNFITRDELEDILMERLPKPIKQPAAKQKKEEE